MRLPTQVLNGKYGYGFDMALMLKDVRQARAFLRDTFSNRNVRIPEQDMLLPTWGAGIEALLVSALERDRAAVDGSEPGVHSPDYTRAVARYFEETNLPGMPVPREPHDDAGRNA